VAIYNLKAGQWEGVVVLWLPVNLDTKGQPIGISEEVASFVCLPAKESVIGDGGKKRNQYYGISFRQPAEISSLIRRVVDGGDFTDYRKLTEKSGGLVSSHFDYNDPWKSRKPK